MALPSNCNICVAEVIRYAALYTSYEYTQNLELKMIKSHIELDIYYNQMWNPELSLEMAGFRE